MSAHRAPGVLAPQEWHEVTAPPPDLATAAGALASAFCGDVLGPGELCRLVADLAARADLWQPLIVCDRSRRRYRLLFEDPRLDVWVLSWMPGQATGFHDHGNSSVALTALRGTVREQQMAAAGGSIERLLGPGRFQQGPPGYIHSVAHRAGEPAVTLHAYSPPLLEVGQYRVGPDGEFRRETQHGRQELIDHSLGAATLL
jgi:hypothetical protein